MREHATLMMVSGDEGSTILEAETLSGMIDDLDFIPPEMVAGMVPILYPIEEYVGDLMLSPKFQTKEDTLDVYRKDGVTHIAMLSMPYPEGKKMMFGASNFTLGYVLYYCAAHNKYRLMHCHACAMCVTAWMKEMQEQWGLYEGRGLQKALSSYN